MTRLRGATTASSSDSESLNKSMNSSLRHYSLDDLKELAREKTAELSAVIGQELQLQWPPRGARDWEFRDWEIDFFFRAYREYSLFELTPSIGPPRLGRWPEGCPKVNFVGDLMPLNPVTREPYVHEFLDTIHGSTTARLYKQEYLTQFSAAGELVGRYGQPADRLLAELLLVRDVAVGTPSRAYAIDLAICDGPRPTGNPVIGAEIKLGAKAHLKLIAALKGCRGLRSKSECGAEHGKCLWIRQNSTVRYLWVRSQDEDDLFEVQRGADTGFDLEPVPDSQVQGVLSRQNWS